MNSIQSPESGFSAKTEERRRARRSSCDHAATVRNRGCFAVQGRLANLTADGCRIVGAGPFPIEGEMWVRIDGLEGLPSRVVWSKQGLTGARFDRPLHPAVVAHYLPSASRMTLVGKIEEHPAHGSPSMPFDDLVALSNRARMMRGVAKIDTESPNTFGRPAGTELAALIKDRVARSAELYAE